MEISTEQIERLAPDQASLKAAVKLLKPASWPVTEIAEPLIWAECQGSGANPYLVTADLSDHGYKCTCPSRKFPCKHVLALLMIYSGEPEKFVSGSPPQWVQDWLGRRRKPAGGSSAVSADNKSSASRKNLRKAANHVREEQAALAGSTDPDPAAEQARLAEKQQKQQQRKLERQAGIVQGLQEFDRWLADQMRTGLSGLLEDLSARCRVMAARLVDARAQGLAGQLDELPARVWQHDSNERPAALIAELGRLLLLSRQYQRLNNNPAAEPVAWAAVSRLVGNSEPVAELLEDQTALRVRGVWEVLASRDETRRDGLIAQMTWLLETGAALAQTSDGAESATRQPRFALLLDYVAASTGRRGAALVPGQLIEAELVFYPSLWPMRAAIAERSSSTSAPPESSQSWPVPVSGSDVLLPVTRALGIEPWLQAIPLLMPPGRLARSANDRWWWVADDRTQALPLGHQELPPVLSGMHLQSAAGLWSGRRTELLSARTDYGRVEFR